MIMQSSLGWKKELDRAFSKVVVKAFLAGMVVGLVIAFSGEYFWGRVCP
jgi:hypothetical protein